MSDRVAGLVLAAGAGTRFGRPKAIVVDGDGEPWVRRVVSALSPQVADVVVVLGAGADEARPLVPDRARFVVAERWADGVSASLRAGLESLMEADLDAVLVALVDQPDLPATVVEALLGPPTDARTLRRMTFAGQPGHPVLIGRSYWSALLGALTGDGGAGRWLAEQSGVDFVAGDRWWNGHDIDFDPDIGRG